MNRVWRELNALGLAIQASQEMLCSLGHIARADQLELVTTIADFQIQALFDEAQMLVELTAEIGKAIGFKGFEGKTMRFCGGVQGLLVDLLCKKMGGE